MYEMTSFSIRYQAIFPEIFKTVLKCRLLLFSRLKVNKMTLFFSSDVFVM